MLTWGSLAKRCSHCVLSSTHVFASVEVVSWLLCRRRRCWPEKVLLCLVVVAIVSSLPLSFLLHCYQCPGISVGGGDVFLYSIQFSAFALVVSWLLWRRWRYWSEAVLLWILAIMSIAFHSVFCLCWSSVLASFSVGRRGVDLRKLRYWL